MSENKGPRIAAIIPAYNEEKTIAKVILLTQRHVDNVIVCDDGSTDMTAMIAERLGATVIRHPVNKGKGEAFRSSFKEIVKLNPDIVVTLDADAQHDPNYIPELVEPILMGKGDIVIGSRYVEGAQTGASSFRKMGLRVINFLCRKATNLHVKDTQSGFRAYSLRALQVISSCEESGYGVESEQLALASKNGLHIIEVPISIKYKGLEKTSKKPPLLHGGELIASILRLVIEERPLRYLAVPGAILASIGAMLAAYLLWMFNITRYFSIPVAIAMLGMILIGLLLVMFAVTLHGLKRMARGLIRPMQQEKVFAS